MAEKFSEVTTQFFQKNFDRYDHDKIGRVSTESIPTLVRVCGATPLEADLEGLRLTADPDGRGSCDFSGFCRALRQAFAATLTAADVREALQGFDAENRGLIKQHELRYFLTTMGDTLSSEEMNELIEEMRTEMDMEGNLLVPDVIYKMTPEMLR